VIEFWWGVAAGAMVVGVVGGPVATRISARLESRWDREADRAVAGDAGFDRLVEALAADDARFSAYQAQYWSWAGIVGGVAVAVAFVGGLAAWSLDRNDRLNAASVVAAATAIVVASIVVFWVRKLVAKRRVTRLVYRRRSRRAR
jgi:NhaP-type Na+/H+ or K+/H+ antiporter